MKNIMTYPPTISTELIEENTMSDTLVCAFFSEAAGSRSELNFFHDFRYIKPLRSELKIWQIKMIIPAIGEWSIPTPTLPIINIGPQFDTNETLRYACPFDIFPS